VPSGQAPEIRLSPPFGGTSCSLAPGRAFESAEGIGDCRIERPALLMLSFGGFDRGRPIPVEVRRPDGVIRRIEVSSDQGLAWMTWPGDPIGQYRVTADQGSLHAEGFFSVAAASQPRLLVLADRGQALSEPNAGPPGSRFLVVLGGYPPRAQVSLWLYRLVPSAGDRNLLRYASMIGVAAVDDDGQGVFALPTAYDDPPGGYLLASDPSAQAGPEIVLRTLILTR
jgi:hypothetical protein